MARKNDRSIPPTCGSDWVAIAPKIVAISKARKILRHVARRLAKLSGNGNNPQSISAVRKEGIRLANLTNAKWAPDLVFCINVLCDLSAQGWMLRVDKQSIAASPPSMKTGAVHADKERIRAAHLIERDAQLRNSAVRKFIREMERHRPHGGKWHSIFSLMRDGRDLASQLRRVAQLPIDHRCAELKSLIRPYVQVVTSRRTCEFTGLPLIDIWRYFRHTWTTPYQNTPGRKIFFLVRDQAAPNHPVIAIGALGSSVVQLAVRDEWIGWTEERLIEELKAETDVGWAKWILTSLQSLIDEIYIKDLIQSGVVRRREIQAPTEEAIRRLHAFSASERALHRLYPAREVHKRVSTRSDGRDWRSQANTHLFKSKRAGALAALLEARRRLQAAGFVRPSATQLRKALGDPQAIRAIGTILRRVKAAHVGIDIMDISVCGAVAPYNLLLAGKLVSLLMASPVVRTAYQKRYRHASSVIASSMAGRSVRRSPQLVLLGTTSLYGVGSSQYNRVRMPAEVAGGKVGSRVEYIPLGLTIGYGSYHFSSETMDSIDPVLRRLQRGRPVNSIFGEGVNPKLRKVRSALDVVGLPADALLQHRSARLVYAVPLATNFRDVLIGRSRRPQYILPENDLTTERIVDYWTERWLSQRIERADVLEGVAAETLAHPIRHRARVALPTIPEELGSLFDVD